jgi:ribosomal protein S13
MRILGITLPENKRLEFALTAIYGVGRSRAKHILLKTGISGALSCRKCQETERYQSVSWYETLQTFAITWTKDQDKF